MTNTQHTPGPWIVGARYSGNKVEIANASYDKVICTVWTHQFQGSTFEPDKQFQPLPYGAANARLIAAAPELLAALQAVADYWAGGDVPADIDAAMRAAIAKATGA